LKTRTLELQNYLHPDEATLNLNHVNLSVKDIKDTIIPFLNNHPQITTLKIGFNDIGDAGAKALSTLTTIRTFESDNSGIGIEGTAALAANTYFSLESNKLPSSLTHG